MKVELVHVKEQKKFKPFSIRLEFESKSEVEKLYALFNNSTLMRELELKGAAESIRMTLLAGNKGNYPGGQLYSAKLTELVKFKQ